VPRSGIFLRFGRSLQTFSCRVTPCGLAYSTAARLHEYSPRFSTLEDRVAKFSKKNARVPERILERLQKKFKLAAEKATQRNFCC